MNNTKRLIGIGLVTTMAAFGMELIGAPLVSAAKISLTCQGITGDKASTLGDSRATLGAISTTGVAIDVDIVATIPAKVRPDGGPFNASFTIDLALPADVTKAAVTTLGLTSLQVRNTTFTVNATGAASSQITKTIPSTTVNLLDPAFRVRETISGKVTPNNAGNIVFRPGTTRMSIEINKSVGPATINTITIECNSNSPVGITSVSVPGAPNIGGNFEGNIWGAGYAGGVAGIKLGDTGLITPDDGNPIVPESLAVTGQAATGGAAASAAGAVWFLAPSGQPGHYVVPMKVCGASRLTKFVAGVNETQKLSWGEIYRASDNHEGLNSHPYGITLKWNGKETAPISLSMSPQLFAPAKPTPFDETQWDFGDRFLSWFQAPSAGTIQAALETITGGPGSVRVGGGGNSAPYDIEFIGPNAKKDLPQIEVGKWMTWLPSDSLSKIIDGLNGVGPTTTTIPGQTTTTTTTTTTIPGTPPRNQADRDRELFAGTLKFDDWLKETLLGAVTPELIQGLTSLFPKIPVVNTPKEGSLEEPSVPTGLLCTSFEANFLVLPQPVAVAGKTVTRCRNVRVRISKTRYRTKRVCSKVAVKPVVKKATRKK